METFASVRVGCDDLTAFLDAVIERAGADRPRAEAVARAVVNASARGFDTHGVRLVPHYERTVVGGRINRKPNMRFTRLAPAIGHLDADDGFGHAASYRAIEEGIVIAQETGIAAVAVGRSSHLVGVSGARRPLSV